VIDFPVKPQPVSTKPAATTTAPVSSRPARKPGAWRRFIPYFIGAALLFAIIAGLRPRSLEVEVATVTTGPLEVAVLEEGKTRIRHRYTISPPIAGYLNRVPLRAGDRIIAGTTVLATLQAQPANFLDPRARAQAEARLNATEAAKQRAESDLERINASLALALKEKERASNLKTTGAISTKDWDTAETQVTMLTREQHSAEFAIRVAEFERAQAQAALVRTENPSPDAFEPLVLIAPVSGYVLNVYEESARLVTAGQPIMEVGDPTDLEAEIELLSSDAVGVQPGAEVSIEQWGGDAPLRGQVTLVEPGGYTKISALGVEEQRVKVRVDFAEPPPPSHPLGDRFRVEARILTCRADKVLQVPTGALFRRGNDWMTFTLSGDKAHLTKVDIAHTNGVTAEIRGGLRQGQTVILHPPDAVTDGAAVKARAAR
jgi:HlyD family secretion protein